MSAPDALIYKFEGFELDTGRFELRRDGVAVPVEPQVLSLLILLAANPDRLVGKDEIVEKIWDNRIVTDMALTDTHPDALSDGQRLPHVDPVPVFGLVYLNRETRGGTLFFQQDPNVPQDTSRSGYPVADMPGFRLLGRLGGTFNRLVIYPGIVPHSGEIVGDWIEGEGRNAYPRLTQRFTFFPSP